MTITYKDFLLTATQLRTGCWHVEIMRVEGGRSVFTQAFGERANAIASAKLTIDRGLDL